MGAKKRKPARKKKPVRKKKKTARRKTKVPAKQLVRRRVPRKREPELVPPNLRPVIDKQTGDVKYLIVRPLGHWEHFAFFNATPGLQVTNVGYILKSKTYVLDQSGLAAGADPLDYVYDEIADTHNHYIHLHVEATVGPDNLEVSHLISEPDDFWIVGVFVGVTARSDDWNQWEPFGYVLLENAQGERCYEIIHPVQFIGL